MSYKDFNELEGLTLKEVKVGDYDDGYNHGDSIAFYTECGRTFVMYHEQDCCECVSIEDICGDLESLVGSPIVHAYESCNSGKTDDGYESQTWTFYNISNVNESVTIRWYGTSNGYYSESVSFMETTKEE